MLHQHSMVILYQEQFELWGTVFCCGFISKNTSKVDNFIVGKFSIVCLLQTAEAVMVLLIEMKNALQFAVTFKQLKNQSFISNEGLTQ